MVSALDWARAQAEDVVFLGKTLGQTTLLSVYLNPKWVQAN